MPITELPDRILITEYCALHDKLGCEVCNTVPDPKLTPRDRASLGQLKDLAASEIFRRHFRPLNRDLSRYRLYLDEDPEDLAMETLAKALATEHRKDARYNPERASFRTWLLRMAHNLRLDHTIWRAGPDAELMQQLLDERTRERAKTQLNERYRLILTNWFREGMKRFGLDAGPAEVRALVDETFRQMFARAEEFDPEETAFIVWLSRIAKAVLATRIVQAQNLPEVPEYVGAKRVEFDELAAVAEEEDLPDVRAMIRELDDSFLEYWKRLMPKERQVLSMTAEGFEVDRIAEELAISKGRVYNLRVSGKRKLKQGMEGEGLRKRSASV